MKRLLLALVTLVVAGGLWAFEPWRAFTHSEVDEALPSVSAPRNVPGDLPGAGASDVPVAAPTPSEPTVLSRGTFVDAEHGTDGTAVILGYPDGRRFLRLEDLDTSDGPDLHVWLSDAKAGGSWFKYDDGEHLRLGELKATRGNQNYAIPAGTDLARFRSAVIWCDRFNVAFGAATLKTA